MVLRNGALRSPAIHIAPISSVFWLGWRGILGLNADYVNQYVQYVADRRLEELGIGAHYNTKNPAKWMAGATDVLELVNFFEAQNTSYEVDGRASDKKKEQ